jgi:hypothetical protein
VSHYIVTTRSLSPWGDSRMLFCIGGFQELVRLPAGLLRALCKLVRSAHGELLLTQPTCSNMPVQARTCRHAVGRRRLVANRSGSSRLQSLSGNIASGQRCVRAILLESLCLQHVCWITALEFSRSTTLLRILCWLIESLSGPGCDLVSLLMYALCCNTQCNHSKPYLQCCADSAG